MYLSYAICCNVSPQNSNIWIYGFAFLFQTSSIHFINRKVPANVIQQQCIFKDAVIIMPSSQNIEMSNSILEAKISLAQQ